MLVRDIIDIDSTYEDFEASDGEDELKINNKTKTKKSKEEEENDKKDDSTTNDMTNSTFLLQKWKRR